MKYSYQGSNHEKKVQRKFVREIKINNDTSCACKVWLQLTHRDNTKMQKFVSQYIIRFGKSIIFVWCLSFIKIWSHTWAISKVLCCVAGKLLHVNVFIIRRWNPISDMFGVILHWLYAVSYRCSPRTGHRHFRDYAVLSRGTGRVCWGQTTGRVLVRLRRIVRRWADDA